MGYVESFNEVVVWIDDDLGSAGTERLKAEIDDLPNIASKQYISKEDALKYKRLTQDKPKCLTQLAGRPLLFWQLDALSRAGIGPVPGLIARPSSWRFPPPVLPGPSWP